MNNNNFNQFISNLQVSAAANNQKYVHYIQDTGEIIKISNVSSCTDDDHDVISATYEEVEPILLGIRRLEDFEVVINFKTKQRELIEKTIKDAIVSIDNVFHKIPNDQPNPDVFIKCYSNRWTIGLSKLVKPLYDNHYKDSSFMFSITDKNDPNILHDVFNVSLKDLIKNYEIDVTSQLTLPVDISNVSIYTFKYFNTYNQEIINE